MKIRIYKKTRESFSARFFVFLLTLLKNSAKIIKNTQGGFGYESF